MVIVGGESANGLLDDVQVYHDADVFLSINYRHLFILDFYISTS